MSDPEKKVDVNEELLKRIPTMVDGRLTLTHNPNHKWKIRDPKDIYGMVLHQSLEEHGSAEGNSRYHSGPNHISQDGLAGLAYTGFIEKTGKIYLANSVECITWSQGTEVLPGDENHRYIAFCVGGNFSGPGYKGTQEPTPQQMDAVRALWDVLKSVLQLNNSQIFGHYSFGKPACPGYTLMKYIDQVQADVVGGHSYNFDTIDGRQKALVALGCSIPAEEIGAWGPTSKGVLVAYQRGHNLTADGVWGPQTAAAISKALVEKKVG